MCVMHDSKKSRGRHFASLRRDISEAWVASGQNIFDLPVNTEIFETVHISTTFVGTDMKRTPRTQRLPRLYKGH